MSFLEIGLSRTGTPETPENRNFGKIFEWVSQDFPTRVKYLEIIFGHPIHKILFSFHINRNWNFRASWERIKEVNVMHMFELHPNSMQLSFLICPISSKNFSNSISNQNIKVRIPWNPTKFFLVKISWNFMFESD